MRKRKIEKVGEVGSDLSNQAHRRLIGYLGILLPILLYVLAGVRPTEGLEQPWQLLKSVSAYYYTGAVGVFIGVLFALSLFLFSYRGYKSEVVDRILGAIAGLAALGVALFPTEAPSRVAEPLWWRPFMNAVHLTSAAVLFGSFILFALWLFRKSNLPASERPPEKQRRNRVFLVCGLAMIVAMLWAASSHFTRGPIFWPETLAIVAFAVSWLVKGEAYAPVVRVVTGWRPTRQK